MICKVARRSYDFIFAQCLEFILILGLFIIVTGNFFVVLLECGQVFTGLAKFTLFHAFTNVPDWYYQ